MRMNLRDHKLAVRAPFGVFQSEPVRIVDGLVLYTWPGGEPRSMAAMVAAGCAVTRVVPQFDVYGGRLWR